MELNVSQTHLDTGVKGSPSGCALALALQDHVRHTEYANRMGGANVGACTYWTGERSYYLSRAALDFIKAFDGRKRNKLTPCTLELGIHPLGLPDEPEKL